jgi:hypothetical protein
MLKKILFRGKSLSIRAVAALALAGLLAGASSCSSPAGAPGRVSGFTLDNFTGYTLRGIYISPSDSAQWEENILGSDVVAEGNSVIVRFSPDEKVALWDLRIETRRRSAEWKGLDLRDASKLTLYLSPDGEKPWVAEIE